MTISSSEDTLTVSTRHVRSVSEVAFQHVESRDHDLRNPAGPRNCSGFGKPRSSVARRRKTWFRDVVQLSTRSVGFPNSERGCSVTSMLPRWRLKFIIAIQSKFYATLRNLINICVGNADIDKFRKRFIMCLMVCFRVRVMA